MLLGHFKKWNIHEPFVILDLIPGKEVNDLTYANELISNLIQYFFNITKVNINLKSNILLGCEQNFALQNLTSSCQMCCQ